MESEEAGELHPLTTEILAALIRSAPELPVQPEVDDRLLAMFAVGWVTQAEHRRAICALAESEGLRASLLEMRKALRADFEAPIANATLQNQFPVLALVTRHASQSLADVLGRWRNVCNKVFSNEDEQDEADSRSARSILRQLSASLVSQPPAMSFTRGDVYRQSIGIEPSQRQAEFSLCISADDRSTVSVEIKDPEPVSDLSLYIVDSKGQWVLLGTRSAIGQSCEFEISDQLVEMCIPAGSLSLSAFVVTEGQATPERRTLNIEIADNIRPNRDGTLTIRVTEQAQIVNGSFRIGVELPIPIRARLDGGELTAVLSAGKLRSVLGNWPISELPNSDIVMLSAPFPGVSDCIFENQACISLIFKGPAPKL